MAKIDAVLVNRTHAVYLDKLINGYPMKEVKTMRKVLPKSTASSKAVRKGLKRAISSFEFLAL